MNCSGVHGAISDYLDDDLDAETGDEMEEHLLRCSSCRALVNTTQRTVDFCRDTTVEKLGEPERSALRESLSRAYLDGAESS